MVDSDMLLTVLMTLLYQLESVKKSCSLINRYPASVLINLDDCHTINGRLLDCIKFLGRLAHA